MSVGIYAVVKYFFGVFVFLDFNKDEFLFAFQILLKFLY